MTITWFARLGLFAAVLATLALAGCLATTSPAYDARFGDAMRAINSQQLIDASASVRNGDTLAATDGRTLREGADRHLGTYKLPPPTTIINLGVGAGGNGR